MEFDLVVRGGTIVDGTGAERFRGDVAVVGDRIVAVGEVDGTGREEIDATGMIVSPGFVDGHTHMDAQVFWDQLGTSSCWQGITTVVMGNCGYTLAPMGPGQQDMVTSHLEQAEEIPAAAMAKGIDFSWTTYADYLDAIDALPKGLNHAGSIGHSALRVYVMGERAFQEGAATEADLEAMERELTDALAAGAVGFSTTRNPVHVTSQALPVASRMAAWDEVVRLVGLVGRVSTAAFQTSGQPGDPGLTNLDHARRLQQLALDTGVTVILPVSRLDETIDIIDEAVAKGGSMWGLTHSRGVGIMQSFETGLNFDVVPEWQEVRKLPLAEQRKRFEDPEERARLVDAAHNGSYTLTAVTDTPDYDTTTIMYSGYLDNPTVAEEAARLGKDPVDVMIDAALEHDFKLFFPQILGFVPLPAEQLGPLFRNPNTAMTFSDAGAHVSHVADCSIQTYLLAYWVRERGVFSWEEAIEMITSRPARMWKLHDRGVLAPGYAADITIFDPDTVAPRVPEVVRDLPDGSPRLEQRADGYLATIVNGQVLVRDGVATDARPGRLLRAGQIPVPGA